jgi:hypothetical protein
VFTKHLTSRKLFCKLLQSVGIRTPSDDPTERRATYAYSTDQTATVCASRCAATRASGAGGAPDAGFAASGGAPGTSRASADALFVLRGNACHLRAPNLPALFLTGSDVAPVHDVPEHASRVLRVRRVPALQPSARHAKPGPGEPGRLRELLAVLTGLLHVPDVRAVRAPSLGRPPRRELLGARLPLVRRQRADELAREPSCDLRLRVPRGASKRSRPLYALPRRRDRGGENR